MSDHALIETLKRVAEYLENLAQVDAAAVDELRSMGYEVGDECKEHASDHAAEAVKVRWVIAQLGAF